MNHKLNTEYPNARGLKVPSTGLHGSSALGAGIHSYFCKLIITANGVLFGRVFREIIRAVTLIRITNKPHPSPAPRSCRRTCSSVARETYAGIMTGKVVGVRGWVEALSQTLKSIR